jgi:hypothetical protein
MSMTRTDIALAFLQAGFGGDDETSALLIGPGFTVIKHPEGFRASTVEELLNAAAGVRSWSDYEFDVERVIEAADGSAVVVQGTLRSTHTGSDWRGVAPTGRRITLDACYVLGFDTEGRIISQDIYEDHLTVLQQIGVVEFHNNETP